MLGVINLIAILYLYIELTMMKEPPDFASRGLYFERLYRTYRNFMINIASIILILEIFYGTHYYEEYMLMK